MPSEKSSRLLPTSRLPAPSLFVPPSRNGSNTSLVPPNPTTTSPSKAPLIRQHSLLGERSRNAESTDTAGPAAGPSNRPPQQQTQQQPNPAEALNNERTDALWAEMQNTLEEVELSATNPVNVFGLDHAKALAELRGAQIALAQAWARSEAEEESEKRKEDNAVAIVADKDKALGTTSLLTSDRIEKLNNLGGNASRPRSASMKSAASDRTQLEEDTENDIRLARKRREANDRYFQRVNAGVLDVVAKLDEVAKAMKLVEQDSKEIWADNESVNTASTVP